MTRDIFVGIDISKARLDVAVLPTEQSWSVPNSDDGPQGAKRQARAARTTCDRADGSYWGTRAACACNACGRRLARSSPSILATPATSPSPSVSSPRPIGSTLAFWHFLLSASGLPAGPLPDEETRALQDLISRRRGKSSTCSPPSKVALRLRIPVRSVARSSPHIDWLKKRVHILDYDLDQGNQEQSRVAGQD